MNLCNGILNFYFYFFPRTIGLFIAMRNKQSQEPHMHLAGESVLISDYKSEINIEKSSHLRPNMIPYHLHPCSLARNVF